MKVTMNQQAVFHAIRLSFLVLVSYPLVFVGKHNMDKMTSTEGARPRFLLCWLLTFITFISFLMNLLQVHRHTHSPAALT